MRVLMLLSSFFPCGQTTHVVSLCETLHTLGHHVELVVTHPANYPKTMRKYVEYLSSVGVQVNIIPHTRIDELLRFVKKQHIDVVHAHSSWDYAIAYAVYKSCGLPYVLTCHGLGLNNPKLIQYLDAAKRLVCVGPRVAASMANFGTKVILLQNAVDLNRFKPGVKSDPFTVVYAGRSDKFKAAGLKTLLEAVNSISYPVRLYLAGTPNIAHYASGRGRYIEWEPRIEKYMNSSHVVVGTGRAIREGMAAGNACMLLGWSYDGLVTPQLLEGGNFADFSGRLKYPLKPEAAQIARDITALYTNTKLLKQLQQFGRSYAEAHFDLCQSAKDTISVYKEALTAVQVSST